MILTTEKSAEYELLDSGDGEKLERFGKIILRRPDPEVLWHKKKSIVVWDAADAIFYRTENGGKWKYKKDVLKELPKEWHVEMSGLKAKLKFQNFKHIGIFPEQAEQWKWMAGEVKSRQSIVNSESGEKKEIKVLNLFGYTGLASVALSQAGASVTHVDAIKQTVEWAKENVALNSISNIRFIVDDARKFVEKEIRRKATYDAIVMDPPVYGKGAKGEVWNIEKDFLPFLARTAELLSDTALFFVVNGYASEYSHISYKNALADTLKYAQTIESGELTVKESEGDRLLPAGIFARASF